MGNQTASNTNRFFKRLSAFHFAWLFVFVASAVIAFIQPAGAVHALEDEQTPVVEPAPTTLVFTQTPTAKTNLTTLTWQWQLTIAEDDTAQYTGYTYSLKTADGTVIDEGTSDATVLSYTKSDAVSGQTYILTVTAITDPESSPEKALTITNSVEVNTVPPVIVDNGTSWSGNTATPGLEVTPGQQPVTPTEPVDPVEPTDPADPTDPVETPPVETPPAPTYTYEWSTDADPRLVTINDTSILNPMITFHADGKAAFLIRVTDAFGNIVEYILNLSYIAPFIPNPSVPLVPDYTPPALTPVAAVVKTQPFSSRVIIDATASPKANENTDEVKTNSTPQADTSEKPAPAVAATSTQGWVVLGLAWYWWVLLVAAIAGSGLLWYRLYTRQHGADDL